MKEHEAVDAALRQLKRNEDGSVDEKKLIHLVAELIDFDADAERRNKAVRAVTRCRRPGFSEPAGQLIIPGLGPAYAYEPNRLIKDGEGRVIEQRKARPEYKQAEAQRARESARRQQVWADRKTQESELYARWAIEQLRRRRPGKDITFDTFVREAGLWAAEAAEPEPGPDDEEVSA